MSTVLEFAVLLIVLLAPLATAKKTAKA